MYDGNKDDCHKYGDSGKYDDANDDKEDDYHNDDNDGNYDDANDGEGDDCNNDTGRTCAASMYHRQHDFILLEHARCSYHDDQDDDD